jgi:hypothetical protein
LHTPCNSNIAEVFRVEFYDFRDEIPPPSVVCAQSPKRSIYIGPIDVPLRESR